MPAREEAQAQVADRELGRRVVFDRVERGIEEPVTLADRVLQHREPGAPPGRQVDRQRPAGPLAPRIVVAEPDEVEVVIGVHVADDDRRELMGVQNALELADHAWPGVQ